jgi:hypothetical protein
MVNVQTEPTQEPCLVFDFTEAESASAAVIDAVSAASGEDPMEMEPLHSAIDPDSIDRLFDSHGDTSRQSDLRLEFSFNGYGVQVSETGKGIVF